MLGGNAQLLQWWQASGFRRSPNMRVYKSADQIPALLLDSGQARHSAKKLKVQPT